MSRLGICSRYTSNETSVPAKQGFSHHSQISKERPDSLCIYRFEIRYVHDFITKLCKQQAKVIQHHQNILVRNIWQGEPDRKYKRLKLGGGQAYVR
jgi:hypothetical protein